MVSNVRSCDALARMSSELVNIRVHHGKGFINYCESGVDLYQFQYVDTSVSNPLQTRHADVLGWLHNFLQMDSLHWRMKVSGVVPRKRKHGWRWELYEMRNSKCWRAFVDMAMHKIKSPLLCLFSKKWLMTVKGAVA